MGRRRNHYYCPFCGEEMEVEFYDVVCPACLWSCPVDEFGEIEQQIQAKEESDDNIDYSTMPECCKACGGPYPSCTTSCKIFDD